jgi:protection-of-telomeres protein 1
MISSSLRKSPKALAELREKLFLMWGDLEEQKGRRSTTLQPIGGNARHLEKEEVPKSKAFHCCLKEYGVKKKIHGSVEREDIGNESSQAEEDNGWGWERRWRMFGTTIV